jgi:hypothetical protein
VAAADVRSPRGRRTAAHDGDLAERIWRELLACGLDDADVAATRGVVAERNRLQRGRKRSDDMSVTNAFDLEPGGATAYGPWVGTTMAVSRVPLALAERPSVTFGTGG